jgi:hypothetical protein
MSQTVEDILTLISPYIWFLFALVALIIFQKKIRDLLSVTIWRVKTGSHIKIASFELGASYVSPKFDVNKEEIAFDVRQDENDIRYNERKSYYEPNRLIFLVHKIVPSIKPNQLYDISIYLIPHHQHDASLISVQKVEYYFGKYWGNRIFTSIDKAHNFEIQTSAYGPFVCTANVYFSDGTTSMLWRYIDFEMGVIGKEVLNMK